MKPFARVELEFCKEVTKKLYKHPLARAFIRPVNPELDRANDYFQIIQKPMDLGTIQRKLDKGEYAHVDEWQQDIKLVWDNAKSYNNDKKSLLYRAAENLSQKCNKIFKFIPKDETEYWTLKLAKANAKLAKFFDNAPPELSTYPRAPQNALIEEPPKPTTAAPATNNTA
ncbi:Bromodomain containing protein [Trichomonas vaginalis G3]|uniref:Bromodomain containing protein n=1 Tax=Trichomonas vaginalis (strain ATCC PRA-98 / G3) TaxID=412133 RepID=A2DF91_TRIV3|nr:acetylation-dependent protein binding [Trichomonas vaginalis G3]EAY20819.1 Bromodomain containing protein [Trichomonas vaginalis G3]KAI5521573.1 acetylation-dependent protein binding [Trichomonas vaginalis G3]|eukprot:XP_001581805.1 Bromodomain containing protein [Trichomonas vaginalis G3]